MKCIENLSSIAFSRPRLYKQVEGFWIWIIYRATLRDAYSYDNLQRLHLNEAFSCFDTCSSHLQVLKQFSHNWTIQNHADFCFRISKRVLKMHPTLFLSRTSPLTWFFDHSKDFFFFHSHCSSQNSITANGRRVLSAFVRNFIAWFYIQFKWLFVLFSLSHWMACLSRVSHTYRSVWKSYVRWVRCKHTKWKESHQIDNSIAASLKLSPLQFVLIVYWVRFYYLYA